MLDSNLGDPVAVSLRDWALKQNVRLVLIKKPERDSDEPRSVFLVAAGERERAVERLEVERPSDLLELDLGRERGGAGWGLGQTWTDPIYLVCTHGRRDPCCAVQGNPVFKVLHEAFPARVWKSTHIGGDRFAANLVSLPAGIMLGRLKIDTAIRVVREMEQGKLDLQHYRGRGFYPFSVQAAEHHLRSERAITGADDLALIGFERGDGRTRAEFEITSGRRYVVTIDERRADEARPLTCHSEEPARPPEYELVSIS